jgi:hypothetical protein
MSTRSGKKRVVSSSVKAPTKDTIKKTIAAAAAAVTTQPKKTNVATTSKKSKKTKKTPAVVLRTTYTRADQPATEAALNQYQTLVAIYKRKGMEKDEAEATARDDMFEVSPAPFGRQKGIMYQLNADTGLITYAASVFTAQSPNDRIRNGDLMAQAESRFKNRAIQFVTSASSETLDDAKEVRKIIAKSMYMRGCSSDSQTYKKYVRNEARIAALKSKK